MNNRQYLLCANDTPKSAESGKKTSIDYSQCGGIDKTARCPSQKYFMKSTSSSKASDKKRFCNC